MWVRLLIAMMLCGLPDLASAVEQVNTTGAQTLTGPKTLTSPIVTDPVVSGTVTGGATYTAPTLTGPTFTGSILGSAIWTSPGAIGTGTPNTFTGSTVTTTGCFVVVTPQLCSGTGSPEGVLAKPVGSQFVRTDGGTGTTLYVKESGVGNTGWVAVSSGGAVTWSVPGTIGSGTPNTGAFTTLSVTGQFSSSLSTGTAPFVITSTTKVVNLNADLLDGADFAAPGPIGGTTPAAITGTTITATTCMVVVTTKVCSGAGSPEGVLTAPVGSLYQRTDGGIGTTLYSKEAGSGNAGWGALTTINTTVDWTVPGLIGSMTPNIGVFTDLFGTRFMTVGFAPTYGVAISIDASLGGLATITATNNTAFTINNPINAATGDYLSIQVRNTSGAALGTITWDTLYKMATFTKPATGFHRTVTFRFNGTNWDEMNCSPEVPN